MAGPRQAKRAKGEGKGARILIVEARFYDKIADALLGRRDAGAGRSARDRRAYQRAGFA